MKLSRTLAALIAISLPLTALGQEGARRETRRPVIRGLLDNVIRPLAKTAREELNPEDVDVGRLNDRFSGLFGSLIQGDTAIEHLALRLDPEVTNLAEDRIGLFGHVRLRKSAWSPAPSDADLDVIASLEGGPSGSARFVIDAAFRIDTDTVALAGWGFEKWRKKVENREFDPQTSSGLLSIELRDYFDRSGPPRSMDEVADVFSHISGARVLGAAREVDAIRDQLSIALEERNDERIHQLDAQLLAARLKRDAIFDARPRIKRDSQGYVREIVIDLQDSTPEEGVSLDRARVTLTDHRVQVAALAYVTKGVQVYQLTKPLVMRTLGRFQRRDGDPALDGIIRGGFTSFRGEIIGEEH